MRTLLISPKLEPVTAAEAVVNVLTRSFSLNDVTIRLIEARINEDAGRWNFILHRKSTSPITDATGILLGHNLRQPDVGNSVIWEGNLFLPRGWVVTLLLAGQLDAGDLLFCRVLYEGE